MPTWVLLKDVQTYSVFIYYRILYMVTILIMWVQLFFPANENLKRKCYSVACLLCLITKYFDKRLVFHIPGEPFKGNTQGHFFPSLIRMFSSCKNQN